MRESSLRPYIDNGCLREAWRKWRIERQAHDKRFERAELNMEEAIRRDQKAKEMAEEAIRTLRQVGAAPVAKVQVCLKARYG